MLHLILKKFVWVELSQVFFFAIFNCVFAFAFRFLWLVDRNIFLSKVIHHKNNESPWYFFNSSDITYKYLYKNKDT